MTDSFQFYSFEFDNTSTPSTFRERCFVYVGLCNSSHLDHVLCSSTPGSLTLITNLVDDGVPSGFEQLLGSQGDVEWAVRLVDKDHPYWESHPQFVWGSLRDVLAQMDASQIQPVVRATQIARWHLDHQFCGRCGQTTQGDSSDGAKVCLACKMRYYPRISPCMITLVTRGDQVLLAHHKRSTRKVYSPLAGFVEAGESAEACVRREVREEVGVELGDVLYQGSQFWPFPHQLMLGFWAEYVSGEIHTDPREILHADWFDYRHLPHTPSEHSIAGKLIAKFVAHRQSINGHETPESL